MDIWTLRNAVTNDEIHSLALKYLLRDYKKPRDKITKFLKSGQLIQVKRGLYVFGQQYRKRLYNLFTLANQIYGPSALSLEFALAYYGLIPERVDTITSITPKRNTAYNTPVGRFTYRYCHPEKYSVGLTLTETETDETHHVIIATPEKALCKECVSTKIGAD